MLDPTEYLPVDGSDEPELPEGTVLPSNATTLFTFPRTSATVTPPTYKLTVEQVRALFITDEAAIPSVRFVVPSSGSERTAGTQVMLQVTATDVGGITQVEFLVNGQSIGFGIGTDNDYVLPYTLPLTGASINIQAKATNTAGRTASATSFLFLGPTAEHPRAPRLYNQVDDAAGGTIQLEPVDNVPMADYRYKVGNDGTYVQVPADGIISVGNVAGVVYAYSVASGNRLESPVTNSGPFTTAEAAPVVSFVAPVNGTTITAGTTVLIRVSAVDPSGGNIISVRLYNAGTLIGNATPNSAVLWQIPYTIPTGSSTINFRAEAISEDDRVTNVSCFIFVTPPVVVVTAPTAPTIGTATAGNNQATATWTAPSNNGGSPITGYKVYRTGDTVPLATATSLYYTDITAVNGTAVSFEVTAVNSAGEGPRSAPSNSVTPTAPALPTYADTFDLNNQTGDGMSFVPSSGGTGSESLHLNARTGTSGPTITVQIVSAGTTCYLDYASEYAGDNCFFINTNGTRFDFALPLADTTLTK
jgi:hypothetical protein